MILALIKLYYIIWGHTATQNTCLLQECKMTIEPHGRKNIPDLNASSDEWKKYWDSCNITEIYGILEKLIQADRKKRPIENKSLYIRALECKEAISKTFGEMIDKNNKLIKDIELGRN